MSGKTAFPRYIPQDIIRPIAYFAPQKLMGVVDIANGCKWSVEGKFCQQHIFLLLLCSPPGEDVDVGILNSLET